MKRIQKFLTKILRRILYAADGALWLLPRSIRRLIIGKPRRELGLGISISTYVERFESCFKPTLKKVCELFPSEKIMVAANGYYDKPRQLLYLQELRSFCAEFPNVELYDFVEPVSISKMVNTLVMNSKRDKKLGLNEDLRISLFFRRFLIRSGILSERIATINHSWAHMVNSKEVIRRIGFWDERLPEIGGEDDDYAARCAIAGIDIKNYNTRTIGSSGRETRKRDTLNSWGKDMRKQKHGYSDLNHDFLHNQKWETSKEPFEGATFVPNRTPKYWKLRPGMETPNFYPDVDL